MQVCLLDVRCFQDPGVSSSAIGRHALGILAHARKGLSDTCLMGLVDPALSGLPAEVRDMLDEVRGTSYVGALRNVASFVQLSPMTHDPLFVARLLLHSNMRTAACVHPLPSRVGTAEARLDRQVSLRWLARYQLFLPVSAAASLQLRTLLGVADRNQVLVGAGTDAEGPADETMPVRFWQAVRRFMAQPRSVPAARVPRVALLTSLPPDRTEVAAYSAAACAQLGRRAELHVFTPTKGAPRPEGVTDQRPLSAVAMLSGRYDRVVGMLDGTSVQDGILDLIRRYGGAVIDHDDDAPGIDDGAEPLMTLATAEGGRAARPRVRLPFGLGLSFTANDLGEEARQEARQRIGIGVQESLLVSFGGLQPTCAPIDCMWALFLLRSWGVEAKLHLLGPLLVEMGPMECLRADLDLAPWLSWSSDPCGAAISRDYLIGADVGLQLQTEHAAPSMGLGACLAAGLPTVTSAWVARAMTVPDTVIGVSDRASPVLIAEAALRLLGRRNSEVARQAYVDEHSMERYADAFCAALNLP